MNKISFILYEIQLNQWNKGKKKCKWLGFVKSTLEKLGFNEVWQSQQSPKAGWLYLSIKGRLQDEGGGRLPNRKTMLVSMSDFMRISFQKAGTDVRARALGISGVNFCPGIRFWEVNVAWALGFWQFLTKKCVIIDKRVKKVTYLLKIFSFGTLKVMETCPVIRFLGTFLLRH